MSNEGNSIFIGSIAFVIFAMARNIIPLHNMLFFIAACIVFTGTALLSYLILNQRLVEEKSNIDRISVKKKVCSILPIAFLVVWMILFYVNETKTPYSLNKDDLVRRYFPFPLWLSLMIVGVVVCLLILRKKTSEKHLKIRKKIRVAAGLLFSCATAVQFYAPNIFKDIQGTVYHSHAYNNSIINVCWLAPYSENHEAVYGHYAILYMPILKLLHRCFHVDYLTGLFIVSAILAGVSILSYLYILDHFAKRDLIFYLGMFAIGEEYFMLMQGGVFLQVHPHRMLFPTILAAFALWEQKRQKKYNIIAIILLALSCVWSTEVGIVMMFSFALYRWVQLVMDGKAFSVSKLLLFIRELLIYALLPFVLAYIITNGYNILAGGNILNFNEFMYPLISDESFIDALEVPLPDVTHAWIGSAILFLGVVNILLFQVLFPNKTTKRLPPFYFLLGIMSLGLMLYYINRPVEGCMFIVMFLMLVLQASILEKGQDTYFEWKENKDSLFRKPDRFLFLSLRIITTFILFIMAFDGIYSMPGAWKTSSETIWKRDELVEFAEQIYIQVPPDAISFGEGVPELMSLIDRDTHLHTSAWSITDIPLDTMGDVRYKLENEPWFFCSLYSLYYLQENYPGLTDDYFLNEIFEYNGTEFGFFIKN